MMSFGYLKITTEIREPNSMENPWASNAEDSRVNEKRGMRTCRQDRFTLLGN